jgi:predicted RNase H-like nuclease (RuvC/YqgF family)
MSKFKNVNDFAVVAPEGVKFLVVKGGKFAQCDLTSLMKKVNEEYPAAVNASITKLDEAQNAAITELTKKIEKMATEIEALKLEVAQLKDVAVAPAAEIEEVAEEVVEKKTKKSKKSAE